MVNDKWHPIQKQGKEVLPEAFKEDGQTISDKIDIDNTFNLYFTNIGLKLARMLEKLKLHPI